MSKKVIGVYAGFIVFFLLLLFYIGNTFTISQSTNRLPVSYEKVENLTRTELLAGQADVKEDTVVYEFALPEEVPGRSTLMFYTIHQNIHVYIEEEEVYSLQWEKGKNAFGKTPGNKWNFVTLVEKDYGKMVRIYVTSPYKDCLQMQPEIFIGDKEAVCIGIIGKELPEYLIDFLLLLVGIVLIVFWIWAYRNVKRGMDLLSLGVFSVLLSIWLGNDLRSTGLILQSPIVCDYISFITLMLFPIPFMLYAKELFYNIKSRSWMVVCGISILQMTVSVVLQLLNIRDFRETLFLIHGILGLIFAWVIYYIIKEIRLVGFSRKMKINIVGMGSCAVAAVVDVILYYVKKDRGTQFLGALTFLIYIIVLSVIAMKETYQMLKLGKMAEKYQTMAYRDQLTGLYNRTAFEEMMNDPVVKLSAAAVVMFDLNDLKKCNDVHGHAAGDDYIMQSAKIIEDAFEHVGTCYRIGGDEFCAIIPEEKTQYCEAAIENLNKKIEEINLPKREFQIRIAYGYAIFDKGQDQELNDTRNRADANMYRRKFDMKGKDVR